MNISLLVRVISFCDLHFGHFFSSFNKPSNLLILAKWFVHLAQRQTYTEGFSDIVFKDNKKLTLKSASRFWYMINIKTMIFFLIIVCAGWTDKHKFLFFNQASLAYHLIKIILNHYPIVSFFPSACQEKNQFNFLWLILSNFKIKFT